jgi:hypothetical protein
MFLSRTIRSNERDGGEKGKESLIRAKAKAAATIAKATAEEAEEKAKKGNMQSRGKGRGWNKPQDETHPNKTQLNSQKDKAHNSNVKTFQGECSYCGIYGQSVNRVTAERENTQRQRSRNNKQTTVSQQRE